MAGTVSQTVGRITVKLVDDCHVAAAIKRNGKFEPQSLAAWADILTGPKMLALDVGAYSGIFAIVAALYGHDVIAIEPVPKMAARVHGNAALNNVKVEVLEKAASDKTGKATLYHRQEILMAATSSLEEAPHKTGSMVVQAVRLDDLSLDGHIGAIKLDVEQHEPAAIRGGLKLIEKHRPVMLIETLEHDDRKAAVKSLLPGYRAAAFYDKRNLLMEPI